MSAVEQAVGSHAYFWLQLAGYLVFGAAWVFISLALMRGLLDLTSIIARFVAARRSTSPVLAIPPARVLAFAPRKTRNRLVVR